MRQDFLLKAGRKGGRQGPWQGGREVKRIICRFCALFGLLFSTSYTFSYSFLLIYFNVLVSFVRRHFFIFLNFFITNIHSFSLRGHIFPSLHHAKKDEADTS